MNYCINCFFARSEMDVIFCRRNAPRTALVQPTDDPNEMPVFYAEWPMVADDDWCGEYKEAVRVDNQHREKMN
jgi:hypothetical protein